MRKIFYITLFLCLSGKAICQTVSLKGAVLESTTQQPLEYATVSLHQEQDSVFVAGTVPNNAGGFVLQNIKAGNYYLKVQFLGYLTRKISNVKVSNQNVNIGRIELTASNAFLNEIVVYSEKAAVLHKIDKQIYNASQFQSAQGGTAVDVLKNLPSVSVNSEGEITLRGSSSFIVLLDGKPTQSDPAIILNQLAANLIDNVEIITTPSSKYDPDGKAGIINITTKKGATDGYYVLANAQGGLPSVQDYGNDNKPIRFSGDLTTNYKNRKWNISLSANYKRDDIAGYRDGEAQTRINNVFTDFPSLGERSYRSFSYSIKGNANYRVNSKNNIEVSFYAGKRSQFRKAYILYKQKRYNETTGEVIDELDYFNKNDRERKGDFVVANIDYNYAFQNRATITLSALYEKTVLGGPTENKDVNPGNETELYSHAINRESNPLDGARLKADYVLPVGIKGKFESGYQYRYLLHKGDFEYDELSITTNTWLIRPDLSNNVTLKRSIHSAYTQFSNETRKLSYSAGLRLEYTDRNLEETSVDKTYQFKRLNLFPSANLLYTLSKGYKLKAGYSRRIVQTTSNMMNPFPARRHSEVLEVGDPKLLPEYVDLAEAGIVKDFGNNSVFANLYYRGTQNVINRVNAIYNDTILVRTFTNAGNATAYGLEAGLELKPTVWWSLFAGGTVYQYAIQGNLFNSKIHTSSINYSYNVNSTFKLVKSLSLQLNVNYTSKTVTAQGEDSRFLIPSMTIKKSLWKGQGSISLQWQNIDLGFDESNQQRLTTQATDFYTSTNYIQEVNILRLNFSYQLNKLAKKLRFTESEFGEKEF